MQFGILVKWVWLIKWKPWMENIQNSFSFCTSCMYMHTACTKEFLFFNWKLNKAKNKRKQHNELLLPETKNDKERKSIPKNK